MQILYGSTDVTKYVLSYKKKADFEEGYILGQIPVYEIDLKLNNRDNTFGNLDQLFTIFEGTEQTGVFKVYEKPEKYTSTISVVLYDNMMNLMPAYNSLLDYDTGTTISAQLDEIASKSGLTIVKSNLPSHVLNKVVKWYDNTVSMINYVGWVAEISGMNVRADAEGKIIFEEISTSNDYETQRVGDLEIEEVFTVSRVCFNNGILVLEKGNEINNTLYINSGNPYVDEQSLIDYIYNKYNGLSFTSVSKVKMRGIRGLCLGDLVKYGDITFMVTSLTATEYGGESYPIYEISGRLETKNEEIAANRIDNSVRIRRLQVLYDQNNTTLNILAQEVDEAVEKVSELELSVDNISLEVSESIENISIGGRNLLTHSGNYTTNSQVDWTNFGGGTIIKNDGYIRFNKTSSSTMSPRQTTTILLEEGKSYAISAKVRSSSGKVEIGLWGDAHQQAAINEVIAIDEWTIVSGTVIANEEKQYCYIRNNDNTTLPIGGYFDLEWIKLEKGNKPTDWTPAPEDIQNELHDNYYTKTETTAQINVAKDSIASEVSSTYVTKTEFGNLEIGGRNYVLDTDGEWSDWVTPGTGNNKTFYPYEVDLARMNLKEGDYISMQIEFEGRNFESSTEGTTKIITQGPVNGAWSSADDDWFANPWASIIDLTDIDAINSANRYTKIYTLPASTISKINSAGGLITLGFRVDYANAEAQYRYRRVKIEKGNKVTDWSPAPEDSNFDSSGLKQEITEEYVSLINQTVSQIDMQVSSIQTVVDENGERISDLQTQLAVTNSAVEISKTTIDTLQSALDGKVSQEELVEYVRFDGATVEIGKSDSQFKTVITNEELAFYQGSNKVAWISNNELHVTNAIITTAIGVGSFQFIDEGSLGFSLLLKGSE